MIQKLTARIFLVCLVSCASLVLCFIWGGGPAAPAYFNIAATFFVVGLGSFLCWFLAMLSSLRDLVRGATS